MNIFQHPNIDWGAYGPKMHTHSKSGPKMLLGPPPLPEFIHWRVQGNPFSKNKTIPNQILIRMSPVQPSKIHEWEFTVHIPQQVVYLPPIL